MADIESNININVDTTGAIESLKNLQRQISAFQKQMQASSAANAATAQNLQRALIDDINATGKFAARLQTVKSSADSFTQSLEKNKLSMGEYFRFSMAGSKAFGKQFATELATVEKTARERVKTLQTQYISLGRDASGALNAISVRPLMLDMNDLGTKQAIAAQKQQIFNQLLKQGSTNLLNFGKNTQWAGRQLMVGFTIPLSIFGSTAAQAFMEIEEQAIRFRRVYGDLMTPSSETDAMIEQIKTLGEEFTKYGVAVKDTMSLAADAAAMGKEGADLTAQVTEATRLAVLGNVSQQQALETSTSITNAFGIATEQLASKIDFLNAVENQTVTSIEDLTEAIPKAGPVVKQLGGSVEDLAFFLTAMKEGGINASEGANALKSGLASLINPTQKAADMLKSYGINIREIVAGNNGDVRQTVIDFAQALDQLDPLTKARAIEQLFGKFQFARLSTLFQNVIGEGTQANRVLELMGQTSSELAALSGKELKTVEESITYKFKGAIEEFKSALAPVGEEFMKLVTPLIEFGTKVLKIFDNMGDSAKGFVTGTIAVLGGLAPVALMTFGLVANGVANLVKGFLAIKNIFSSVTNGTRILGEDTGYLSEEQLRANAVAASLEQTHSKLPQIFTSEASAIDLLTAAYNKANTAAERFARRAMPTVIPGAGSGKTKKFSTGGFVSGTGNGDTVPAMLTPGEFVVKKDVAQKTMPFLQALNNGKLPGFANGGIVGTDFAHVTDRVTVTVGELLKALENGTGKISQAMLHSVRDIEKTFGPDLQAHLYSGLGFTQGRSLNIGMRDGGAVSAQDFLQDFESQGIEKWKKSIRLGGAKMDQVVDDLSAYDTALMDGLKSLIAQNKNATITSEQFAALEKEVRKTIPETSQLRQALDRAEQGLYQFRINPTTADAERAGLVPYQVPSSADPSRMSAKKRVRTPGGKEIRLGGNKFERASEIAGLQLGQFVQESVVKGVEKSTQQASPSKKAFEAGENIGIGAIQGIISAGKKTQSRNFAAGRNMIAGTVVADNISGIGQKAMLLTGALSSATMAASMFGVELGSAGEAIFNVSNSIFALSGILEILTKASFFKTMLGAGKTAMGRIAAQGGMTAMNGTAATGIISGSKNILANSGRIISSALGSIGTVGTFIRRLIPGINLAIVAFSAFQIVAGIMEEQRKKIEGLGETAFLTSEKMAKAGELLNFQVRSTSFAGSFSGTAAGSSAEQQTSIETLRGNEDFKNEFGTQISAISNATAKQAEMALKSLAIQMASSGAPKEAVDTMVKAIAAEAGRTDLNLEFTKIDLSTKEGIQQIGALAKAAGQQLGVEFDKGFKPAITAVGYLGQSFTRVATQSEDLEKQAELAASEYSSVFTALKLGFESGMVSAQDFNAQMNIVSQSLNNLDPAALGLIVPKIAEQLGIKEQLKGIKDYKDQIMLIKAAAAGVTLDPKQIEALLLAQKEGASPEDLKKAADARRKINDLISKSVALKEADNEATLRNEEIEAAKTSATEKITELRNQIDAYKLLSERGYSSAEAQAIASDAMWATAIAAARAEDAIKGNTNEMDALLTQMKLLKNIEGEAAKFGLGDRSGGGGGEKSPFQKAIESLKEQKAEITNSIAAFGKLTKAGLSASTAFEMAKDNTLAAALASTKVGTAKWKELLGLVKQLDKAARENALIQFLREKASSNNLLIGMTRISPILSKFGLSLEDIQSIMDDPDLARAFIDDLKDGVVNSKRIADAIRSIPNEKQIKIKFNMSTPEGMEEEFDKLYDSAMSKFDTQQRRVEQSFRAAERSAENSVEFAQNQVNAIQESIDNIQTKIESKQRDIELTIDRPIELLNQQVAQMERSVELNFDRPIQILQSEASVLSNDLQIIDNAVKEINDRYEKQQNILDKISQINSEIVAQDKERMSIADALASGDASAAARALREAQAQESARAAERAKTALEATKNAEIERLKSSGGLTRDQIEKRQFEISQQVFKLEQNKALVAEKIKTTQDQIFSIESKRQAILDSIRVLEDSIYTINLNQLTPAQNNLKIAEDALSNIQKQKQTSLDAIDAERLKWEETRLRIDEAKTAGVDIETIYQQALNIVVQIEQAWKNVKTATLDALSAAKTITTSATSTTDTTASGSKVSPNAPTTNLTSTVNKLVSDTKSTKTAVAASTALAKLAGATPGRTTADTADKKISSLIKNVATKAAVPTVSAYTRALLRSSGGIVPKYFANGGLSRGTDTVPAMLTPGEFVVKRFAVQNFGADKLKAINSGTYEGESVYNYSVNVNVKSDANADDIARSVISQIKQIDSQRIRGNRF